MSKSVRVLFVIVVGVCGFCFGETSLFVIPSHSSATIAKYEVDGVKLVSLPDTITGPSGRAVGLACDPELGLLFLTAEDSGQIYISDMISMQYKNSKVMPGAGDLAGIVADVGKKRVYAIERHTNHLYVLTWKYSSNYDFVYPEDYVELENCGSAYGIALDEEKGLLYVADNTQEVKYYSTTDWSHNPNTDYISVSHDAISVAVDPNNHYLYTGFMYDSDNLSQYDLVQETEITIDAGGLITGLTVDPGTSRIYLATLDDYVEILSAIDPNGTPNLKDIGPDPTLQLTSPVGMVVINDDIYKPGEIGLMLDDGINTEDPNGDNYVDCIDAGEDFTYTITVDPNGYDHDYVEVTLYLPAGVSYENFSWNPPDPPISDPNYDTTNHTYTWQIEELLSDDDPVTLTLDVTVNDYAQPNGTLVAGAVARSDIAVNSVIEETPICCWYTGEILFVDKDVSHAGYGTSWEYAYRDLQPALKAIREGCSGITEVWVAEGTYKPGLESTDTFEIPDGVEVYGGFAGVEDPNTFDLDTRDFIANKTVLDSFIGLDEEEYEIRTNQIVTMGDETLLDGFTVKNAGENNVYAEGNVTIQNCIIQDSTQTGITLKNADATIKWCVIKNNVNEGILQHIESTSNTLDISNCRISDNLYSGIKTYKSDTMIINSVISKNGFGNYLDNIYGLLFTLSTGNPVVRNCTIVHNKSAGIRFVKPPGTQRKVKVTNCILAYNNKIEEN